MPSCLTTVAHLSTEQTIVGINAWVANVNQEVFGPDALSFRPERWLDATSKDLSRMNDYYLTVCCQHCSPVSECIADIMQFGKGPRACLGKNISMLELNKVIPELVLNFDFQTAHGSAGEWTLLNDWFVRQRNFKVGISKRAERA